MRFIDSTQTLELVARVAFPSFGTHLEVYEDLRSAEPAWRALEKDGILTPYQSFDWVSSYVWASGQHSFVIPCLFKDGSPAAIMPLFLDWVAGLRRGRLIGSAVGNSDWLPLSKRHARSITTEDIGLMISAVQGRPWSVSFLQFGNQPNEWQGHQNPLLGMSHQPAPDHLYRGLLHEDPAGRIDAKRLRNLRRGRRRLEESHGAVRLFRATRQIDIDLVRTTFLAQRDVRFHNMGIANPFAREPLLSLLRDASRQAMPGKSPSVVMHGLLAGHEIVATAIGLICGSHYSQYINSMTDGPPSKYSLMAILMHDLVRELQADGIRTIDLGVGDFDYKLEWTEKEVVYDSFVPLSPAARLVVPILSTLRTGKRTLKQDERMWAATRRVRSGLHRILHPGATQKHETNERMS